MQAVVYCPDCRDHHPVIAGRPACPKPAKHDPDRPRCGLALADIDLEAKQWPK